MLEDILSTVMAGIEGTDTLAAILVGVIVACALGLLFIIACKRAF